MKATPLLIAWHNGNAPVYSVHFDPHVKGRFATAGNDNNVRTWKLECNGEERKVTYLSTLVKHTQAVNVVRFSPKGEMLASAGDDGNVLLWVPSELSMAPLGEDHSDDKETWRVKHMCRSSGAEIYDLAWSPDGVFIITGSMDNVTRIYNAQTGQMVRQIAEHSHYVQGVAWDPLNEFVATQSSDRSVHIYSLKTKDGQFSLTTHGKFSKMDLPARRIPASSPAPTDTKTQSVVGGLSIASPAPSTPGTPKTMTLPMDPPPVSHSRRSSFGSSPSIRRSASPAPSLPLPAVKPMEVSSPSLFGGLGVRNANLYANESFTSFFRRLTFTPDGSLLFTPAGQFKTTQGSTSDSMKASEEIINTVYIYTRAGFNKPPIAHLPGHKKPSVAVRCSPIYYTLRQGSRPTNHITLDTSSGDDSFPALPDPVVSANITSHPSMEPPPPSSDQTKPSPKTENDSASSSAFALPYRLVYAVATQDAVFIYDTQQQTPLCVVNNLHFATFTDLSWSSDGLTLIMSSSDGFCSTLSFASGELGQPYTPPVPSSNSTAHHHTLSASSSSNNTPLPTPTHAPSPSLTKQSPAPASSGPNGAGRASSPARSSSASSIQTLHASQSGNVINNPTPTLGTVPPLTATNSLPLTTPPQTPLPGISHSATSSFSSTVLGKRDIGAASESEREEPRRDGKQASETEKPAKKRRIAPTLVSKDSASFASDVESKPVPPQASDKVEPQPTEDAEQVDQ
ncbi:chromatin assembly factor 1 subunit B, putative [Talaromyces stipitatus ATCC 10500]|uniref:Chromatin assembly factor 1 subunit B, putative n=1 Tax=Talaromyces stipitatus (strain ATCC 10500 / CBS 375.48 / QM 6759 / NRRL 1006) TaxID=441959 RepID=B8MGW7_TALSN|nr:chromatin assembly factor 1 subunit B, putative [Talaromyces stipitatus ATCC 10500]EED16348.1 chromatin assembly factor 1 subunit B, putative [Talaromyces stipitatus ATCC 10500]